MRFRTSAFTIRPDTRWSELSPNRNRPRNRRRKSESRQALRTVVGNFYADDLAERPVRTSGVAHQLRSIPVDLVEVGAIRGKPAVARSAAHGSIDRPEGPISLDLRRRRVLRDSELGAVDPKAADVAVTEIRCVHQAIIRRDRQPAELRGPARAVVDLREPADADLTVFVDGGRGTSASDGI